MTVNAVQRAIFDPVTGLVTLEATIAIGHFARLVVIADFLVSGTKRKTINVACRRIGNQSSEQMRMKRGNTTTGLD